uniref:peptidylprolyl isomerase n=1 Tax=Bos mutus grunniens TaxID=30521 RepID=A0A8B9WW61_BOSMU
MRLSWVLTVLSICLSALVTATGTEGKRKLQIGVKKRVDHCPIKSRKGRPAHALYGKLEDGTEFDSSLPQNQPFVFSLGTGQVNCGRQAPGMGEGARREKRKLVIPSELGKRLFRSGATLVFEVELLKIERRSEL